LDAVSILRVEETPESRVNVTFCFLGSNNRNLTLTFVQAVQGNASSARDMLNIYGTVTLIPDYVQAPPSEAHTLNVISILLVSVGVGVSLIVGIVFYIRASHDAEDAFVSSFRFRRGQQVSEVLANHTPSEMLEKGKEEDIGRNAMYASLTENLSCSL